MQVNAEDIVTKKLVCSEVLSDSDSENEANFLANNPGVLEPDSETVLSWTEKRYRPHYDFTTSTLGHAEWTPRRQTKIFASALTRSEEISSDDSDDLPFIRRKRFRRLQLSRQARHSYTADVIRNTAVARMVRGQPGQIQRPHGLSSYINKELSTIRYPDWDSAGPSTRNLHGDLCQGTDFLDPTTGERLWSNFFRSVQGRMDKFAARLSDTFEENFISHRRILHDSINYRKQNETETFKGFVERLVRALNRSTGVAIFFHEESIDGTVSGYPYHIARGFEPTYDYTLFEAGEVRSGKYVLTRPTTEEEEHSGIVRGRGGLKPAIYFPDAYLQEESSYYEKWPEPERGHFHILHNCNWYNKECRCLSRSFDVNKRKNTPIRAENIQREHIRNILRYNTKWPRWAIYIKVPDSEEYRFVYRAECVREEELQPNEPKQLEGSCSTIEVRPGTEESTSETALVPYRKPNNQNRRESQNGDRLQKIIRQFQTHPSWPLEHILQTTEWLNGPYGTWLASDKTIKRAIELLMLQTMHYTYIQFLDKYLQEDCKPIWGAHNYGNLTDYYHTIDESIDIIEYLLDFQAEYNEQNNIYSNNDLKKKFCTDLYDILEKKRPKVNCFQIIGEPSAGKNFFIDAILSFYWNTGIIQNFNRYHQFPLMEAVNRRVNLWNEPNFEPSSHDTLKMLLAGDALKVQVKYQKEQNLIKTPIIVLTNKAVFPNTQAFHDRICTYNWTRCEHLKQFTKKLHPMIWRYLVNTYVFQNIDID